MIDWNFRQGVSIDPSIAGDISAALMLYDSLLVSAQAAGAVLDQSLLDGERARIERCLEHLQEAMFAERDRAARKAKVAY